MIEIKVDHGCVSLRGNISKKKIVDHVADCVCVVHALYTELQDFDEVAAKVFKETCGDGLAFNLPEDAKTVKKYKNQAEEAKADFEKEVASRKEAEKKSADKQVGSLESLKKTLDEIDELLKELGNIVDDDGSGEDD